MDRKERERKEGRGESNLPASFTWKRLSKTHLINNRNANPSPLIPSFTFLFSLFTVPFSSSLRMVFFKFSHKLERTKFVFAIVQLFNTLQNPSVGSLVTDLEHHWKVRKSPWGGALWGKRHVIEGKPLKGVLEPNHHPWSYTSWSPWGKQAAFHVFLPWDAMLPQLESSKSKMSMNWNFWNHETKSIFLLIKLNISGVLSHYEKLHITIFLCLDYFI